MKKIYFIGLTAAFALAVNAQSTIRIKNPLVRHNSEANNSVAMKGGGNNSIAQVNGNLVCNTFYSAGTTMDLEFTFFQTGDNTEWIDMFTLTFPAGITPNSSPNATFPSGSTAGGAEPLNPIVGQDISWGADIDDGYGGIADDGTGLTFTVNVTIGAGVSATQIATFLASGDTYTTTGNPTPGNLSGSANIYEVGTPIVDVTANLVGVLTSPATQAMLSNCSLGTHTVACQIKNLGANPASNIPVNYSVNGVNAITPFIYAGPLAAGDSALVVFPITYDFSAQNIYDVAAFTALSGDMFASNDIYSNQITNSLPVALSTVTYSNGIESAYDYASLNLDWTNIGLPFGPSTGTKHTGAQALFYTVNMTTIGAPAGTYEAFINLPCTDVINGETYRISYWKKANTSGTLTVNGQSGLFTGVAQDAASMTTILKAYSAITPNAAAATWTKDSVDYVAAATETRYFAIGGKGTLVTTADQINVRIDDIKIAKVTSSVGIKGNTLNQLISIFPNPTAGILNINAIEANGTIEVYNVIGDKVYSNSVVKGNNSIDLSGLANGAYFLKVNSNNQIISKKVVLSK
jgi:hypothetical protein